MSAPYDDEGWVDTENRPCMLCHRRDCPGHFPPITAVTLTEEQILDAAARLVAPLAVCWRAFDVPGEGRDRAREEIAWLLEQERKS